MQNCSFIDIMNYIPPMLLDDGHGDYNRSYEKNNDGFDYADYSTDTSDNNFVNYEKKVKKKKSNKEILEHLKKHWAQPKTPTRRLFIYDFIFYSYSIIILGRENY